MNNRQGKGIEERRWVVVRRSSECEQMSLLLICKVFIWLVHQSKESDCSGVVAGHR